MKEITCTATNPQDVCWNPFCHDCANMGNQYSTAPPKSKRWLSIAALCVSLSVGGCDTARDISNSLLDKSQQFGQISTGYQGTTREQIAVLMGNPDTSNLSNAMGIEGEALQFRDRSNIYSVLLVNKRAVAKSASPMSSSPKP
jgi:hypothetical protein